MYDTSATKTIQTTDVRLCKTGDL